MVASLHHGSNLVKMPLSIPASVEVQLLSQYPRAFLIDQRSNELIINVNELIAATYPAGSNAVKGV
jgi:hypothetical protein